MIYVFKVIASDWEGRVRGRPYRVIAIPDSMNLYSFAQVILDSFDFSNDHVFGFYDNVKNWHKSKQGYELFADLGERMGFPGVQRAKVGMVFDKLKKKMLFLFDYGDEWRFVTQLIKIQEPFAGTKYPIILESKGEVSQYGDDEDNEFEDE